MKLWSIAVCAAVFAACGAHYTLGSQPLSSGDSGAVDAGGGDAGGPVRCGSATCATGMVCCNPSCGICTPPGGGCTKQYCASVDGGLPDGGNGGCGLTPAPCNPPQYPPALVTDLKTASFVFSGTVTQLDFSSPDVNVDVSRQVAVSVTQAFPATLAAPPGSTVMVVLPAVPTFQVGYSAYFFTNAIAFGQLVDTTSVDVVDPSAYPSPDTLIPAIQQALADQKLYQRLVLAQSLVVGNVVATQDLAVPSGCPGSEHSPTFANAVVSVDCALSGSPDGTSLNVGFNTSVDVAWFATPKLDAGEQALMFLMPSAMISGGAQCAPTPEPFSSMVLDPLDVEPVGNAQHVLDVLTCPPNL